MTRKVANDRRRSKSDARTAGYAGGLLCAAALFTAPTCSKAPRTTAPSLGGAAPHAPTAPSSGAAATVSNKDGATFVGANGMRIYKNPITGAFEVPPPGATTLQPSPQMAASLNTSPAGLVEVKSPGGGTMIDLRGRFQSFMRANVSKDGTTVTGDCTTDDSAIGDTPIADTPVRQ